MWPIIDKFVYHLYAKPLPTDEELDLEISRLFFIDGNVGQPTHLVGERDLAKLDSDVIYHWLRRKFEPALILLMIQSEENHKTAKVECSKMHGYQSFIDRFFRFNFVERRANQRLNELCFDDNFFNLQLQRAVMKLKRTLTFLSKQLDDNLTQYDNLTLQNTEAYTNADVALYNYLKRIIVGKYRDLGLKSHVKLCDSLVKFMRRYEQTNPHIEPAREDSAEEESTLIQDLSKPAIFAIGLILLFIWRRS